MGPNPTDCSDKKMKLGYRFSGPEKGPHGDTGRRELSTTSKGEKEASAEHNPADSLISNFKPPELRENQFLLFKAPSRWFSVLAAP